jgi:hypothetical protein
VNGPSIRCDIADSTGLSHGLVARSRNKLKSAGVVTAEPLRDATTARIPAYSLDAARAEDLLNVLASYVNGKFSTVPVHIASQ